MSAYVHHNNGVICGQRINLRPPHLCVAEEAVEEQKRLPVAVAFKVYFVSIDIVAWHGDVPSRCSLTGIEEITKWSSCFTLHPDFVTVLCLVADRNG